MTKKDYVAIAKVIKSVKEEMISRGMTPREYKAVAFFNDNLMQGLVSILQAGNPRFNSSKFMDACALMPFDME